MTARGNSPSGHTDPHLAETVNPRPAGGGAFERPPPPQVFRG